MSKKRRIFARFVVDARDDADVWQLSDAAFRLWWASILWCRDKGNDGYLPSAMVPGLSPVKKLPVVASELEQAGFWIANGDGYWIKSYADYQDTAQTIAARQKAAAIANAAQGKGTGSVTDSDTGSVTE